MKIVAIGPIKPYRGGIAHSNEMLCTNLSKNHEVKAISFKRLFPKIIYPGRFQVSGNRKNNGKLDSINPLNWAITKKEIADFDPDFIVFQWWTTFLWPCYSALALGLKAKKIAVCQNVFPHHEGALKKFTGFLHELLTKNFLGSMDRLVAMSNSDKKILQNIFPGKETGLYLELMYEIAGIKSHGFTREKARKMLGVKNANVLLFFGFVREYKGLKYLLEAMPDIVKKTNARLFIVGEFWQRKSNYLQLIEKLGIKDNVVIVDEYVPDSEVPKYFMASDLLVLPYTSISESGVIRMALNFNLPIISTNVGGNPDHIEDGYNGFLVEPENPPMIAEKAIEFFEKKLFRKMSVAMKEKKKGLVWGPEKEKAVLGN